MFPFLHVYPALSPFSYPHSFTILYFLSYGSIPMFPFIYPHSYVSIHISPFLWFDPFPCPHPMSPFPYLYSYVSIPPERVLEDHEKVVDAISHWPRDHTNFVMFKNNPEKYHVIKRPQVCSINSNVNKTCYYN